MKRFMWISVLKILISTLLAFGTGLYSGTIRPARSLDLGFPLKVIYQQDPGSKLTIVRIAIPAGFRTVPGNRRGLAFLTARTAMEIPSASMARDLLEKGIRLSSHVDGDQAILTMITLSEHFNDAAAILGSILRKPLVSGIRIQRIKKTMSFRDSVEKDSPRSFMRREMTDHFLGSRGYGGGELGCELSRKNIRSSDVKRHLEQFYNAENMRVSVVSDIDAPRIQDQLRASFHSLPKKSRSHEKPQPAAPCSCEQVSVQSSPRELSQPMLAWGMKVPELSAESFVLTRLLARVLARGPGSMAWRLRDPLGLAYTVDCDLVHFREGGVLMVFLYTGTGQIALARSRMEALFQSLLEQGIPGDILAAAIRLEVVAWQRSLQSKAERSFWLASISDLGSGVQMVDGYIERIRKISKEDLDPFMRAVLKSDTRRLVVLGGTDPQEE